MKDDGDQVSKLNHHTIAETLYWSSLVHRQRPLEDSNGAYHYS